jgi:tetratricopeptide (TPR) repeat protein
MIALPVHRRVIVATVALLVAFALFRAQLASAVVTRGDDALRAGDIDAAIRLYDRAAQLDPHSAVAADRLAFNLALHHGTVDARRSQSVATHALESLPGDAALFADRAFADMQLREWTSAERDFAAAGDLGRDPRYEHFAARMALHLGNHTIAAARARRALAFDPAFTPARALLRALR